MWSWEERYTTGFGEQYEPFQHSSAYLPGRVPCAKAIGKENMVLLLTQGMGREERGLLTFITTLRTYPMPGIQFHSICYKTLDSEYRRPEFQHRYYNLLSV